jgi:O-antigen/teichoic acid export membrane protein
MQLSPFDTSTAEGRSKERYRRIAMSTAVSAIAKGMSVLITLISVPLTVNYLGTERYGLWMTISSVISMLGFADLGMGNGLLNAISEANGKDDRKAAATYVSSAFFMLLAIAMLTLTVFALVYPFIQWSRIFNVTSNLAIKESGPTMAVLIASFAINMPLGIAQRVQMGYQEDFKNQLWAIVGQLIALAGLLLVIYFKAGLLWLVIAMSGGPALARLINWIVLFSRSRAWLFPRWKAFNWSASRKIAGTGVWFFLLQLFTLIGTTSDNFVIAQFLGASAVANYAVTQKLFSVALVSQFFLAPLWPAFGEAMARSDYAWARRTLNRSLILSLGIGIATVLPLLVFGKQIVVVWVGSDLMPSTLLMVGFAFWLILASYGGTMSTFLNSGYLVGRQVAFISAASIASLALKVFLIHKWQAAGVIWATVFGYGLFYVIPSSRLAYRSVRASKK